MGYVVSFLCLVSLARSFELSVAHTHSAVQAVAMTGDWVIRTMVGSMSHEFAKHCRVKSLCKSLAAATILRLSLVTARCGLGEVEW